MRHGENHVRLQALHRELFNCLILLKIQLPTNNTTFFISTVNNFLEIPNRNSSVIPGILQQRNATEFNDCLQFLSFTLLVIEFLIVVTRHPDGH